MKRDTLRGLRSLILGALSFLAVHAFLVLTWERWFAASALEAPWFLGSRQSILLAQAVLFAVALVRGLWARETPAQGALQAAWLAAGVALALIAVFFAVGPERLMVGRIDLWPLALISGVLLTAPAIGLGAALAVWIRRGRTRSD